MEAARSKALADVEQAWSTTFHEIFMDRVESIIGMRNQDPVYIKTTFKVRSSKSPSGVSLIRTKPLLLLASPLVWLLLRSSKVGYGIRITEAHKKSLYHIMTAGMDDPEVQNSTRRRMNADYFAKCGGKVLHVPLKPLRDCMVACIQYGRGLDGLRPKEACELILEFLATRTQACFRGLQKRRVIQKAMRMWKNKEAAFKSIYYSGWAKWALNRVALRRFCWRPLREWNKLFKGIKMKQYMYKTCYWPYYVWRRWTARKVTARKKAKLLKRIWHVYDKLRHFGAWRRLATSEMKKKKVSTAMRMKLMRKFLINICNRWRRYAQRRAGIRLSWDKRGHRMMEEKRLELMYRCLNVWRYFKFCKQELKKRVSRNFRDFMLDEEDRRGHAAKMAAEAMQVASQPRSHVEHMHHAEFDEKPCAASGSASISSHHKAKKWKKGKGKKGSKAKKDTASKEGPKRSPRPVSVLSRLDSSPGFLSEGIAQFKAEAEHRASLAGKVKPVDATYVAPVGNPFHGTKYSHGGADPFVPRTPPFPLVTESPWAIFLPPDMLKICSGCHERFKLKDELEMKVYYSMYHRTAPRALQFMYNHVVLNKKVRSGKAAKK